MIEALGIYIGNRKIYISGITTEDDSKNISYYTILDFSKKNEITKVLNEWYKNGIKEFSNIPISINLPSLPILRIVEFEENSTIPRNRIIGWEIDNFLLNQEDFTHSYDIIGNSAIIAFAQKDEILEFINSLSFNISVLENSILGLANILNESHNISNTITIFAQNDDLIVLATISGNLKEYKFINNSQNKTEDLKNYIEEVKKTHNIKEIAIFLSGSSDVTDFLLESLKTYEIGKLNPFINMGQTNKMISESNIAEDGVMLPISLGFALNCLN